MYCKRIPCVDDKLAQLHGVSIGADAPTQQSIDSYLYICAIADNADAGGCEQQGGAGVQRMTVGCLCGDPNHTIAIDKPRGSHGCFPFDIRHLTKQQPVVVRQGHRYIRAMPCKVGAKIPARCFIADEADALQFEALPDMGMYIRMLIIKRYCTSAPVKHFRKCASYLQGGQGVEQGTKGEQGGSAGEKLSPIAFVERFVDGLCCSLLQDSIPCMKRAKRSVKETEFKISPTSVEVAACINVLHGTLLSLYPKAARRPTFGARVQMAWRLRELLCRPMSEQMEFLKTYPSLVKLCFMEYVINVILEYMPCERELLCQGASMRLYQTVCPTTCDSFRSETLKNGAESWKSLNAVAGVCIDRCIRMCKFKMFRCVGESQEGTEARRAGIRLADTCGALLLTRSLLSAGQTSLSSRSSRRRSASTRSRWSCCTQTAASRCSSRPRTTRSTKR